MEEKESPKRQKQVKIDPAAETIVLAAMLVDAKWRSRILRILPKDRWQLPQHKRAVEALEELERRKLGYDAAAVKRLFPDVDSQYLDEIALQRPEPHPDLNVYIELVRWDATRADVLNGPLGDLIEAIADPKAEPVKVRSFAKAVAEGFGQWRDEARVQRPDDVHAEMCRELDARLAGHGVFPYGLEGLDVHQDEPGQPPRLIPAAKPGLVTVITGLSGGGKTTAACRIALGQIRLKRRVLFGAWEMNGAMSEETLAVMSLAEDGWRSSRGVPISRKTLQTGKGEGAAEMIEAVKERGRQIVRFVRFVPNPFQRGSARAKQPSNDQNLDIIEHLIEDNGADVFIADLWERCIVDDEPSEVGQALFRQQAMCERHRCHGILLQQQRLKDVEARADRRPTREGIKGTAAWVEIADTILGCHRPALFKAVPDDVLIVDVLKQRYGPWPLTVELEFKPDQALFGNGTSVPYDQPGSARDAPNELDAFTGGTFKPGRRGKGER